MTILTGASLRDSPRRAVFGPVPGTPFVAWLAFVTPFVAAQVAVGLALRRPRAAGEEKGAIGIAALSLTWVAVAMSDLICALVNGMRRYVEVG